MREQNIVVQGSVFRFGVKSRMELGFRAHGVRGFGHEVLSLVSPGVRLPKRTYLEGGRW